MSATAETHASERHPSGIRRGYERLLAIIDAAPIAVRVLAAIGVLALLVAAAFVVVLLAMSSLRASTDEQVRVNRVTAATLRLQGVVDELDQSLQGFVLTRNSRIRESWERAGRELVPATATLEKVVAEQPEHAALGRGIVERINDVRHRVRRAADLDRAREPERGTLAGRLVRGADADRPDPQGAGRPARP